jgi:hypothetical protein
MTITTATGMTTDVVPNYGDYPDSMAMAVGIG